MYEYSQQLAIGPFSLTIQTDITEVKQHLARHYQAQTQVSAFSDFHIRLKKAQGLRRWFRPQAEFWFDEFKPFKPLPLIQAAAFLEWGLNWVIASQAHDYLIIHAAVAVRNGQAIILPGRPGSGKSTLSAWLSWRGWQVFSDELAMISLEDGLVHPLPRPVSLKEQSISIIAEAFPEANFGPVVEDTAKGRVSHMRLPQVSQNARLAAEIVAIVFPAFTIGKKRATLETCETGRGFLRIAEQAFNYSTLGEAGFDSLCKMLEKTRVYDLQYNQLAEAEQACFEIIVE